LDVSYVGGSPRSPGPIEETSGIQTDSLLDESTNETIPLEINITTSGDFFVTSTLYEPANTSEYRWGSWWNPENESCGDLASWWRYDDADLFVVADGLGKGKPALEASRRAIETVDSLGNRPVDELAGSIHDNLHSTRGAVVFLGRLPDGESRLQYCSIGDIKARFVGPDYTKELFGFNGTVGFRIPEYQMETEPFESSDKLIVHTDGLNEPPNSFYDEGFFRSDPLMNTARLLHRFQKRTDDSLVGTVGAR
jgi:hypothetical protein